MIRDFIGRLRRFFFADNSSLTTPPSKVVKAAERMERAARSMDRQLEEIRRHPHPLEELVRRARENQK